MRINSEKSAPGKKLFQIISMGNLFKVPSFAKINLGLEILRRRDDGYHSIESIFQTISLHDDLYFTQEGNDIEVFSDDDRIPDGPDNLVYKAARLFEEQTQLKIGYKIRINKRIPVEGGLGGGSSNAGVTLLTLNKLFDYPLTEMELIEMAKELGSDVPFFIKGGTAHVTGRGEEIDWVDDIPKLYLLLAVPDFGISTEWAYRMWDEKKSKVDLTRKNLSIILKLLLSDKKEVVKDLRNSFIELAIKEYPCLGYIRKRLWECKPINVLMSGSGPVFVAIFGSESLRDRVREILIEDSTTLISTTISRHEYFQT
ncbi:4-(cytidine 5'-diphospho)-2-C-methyl-D-erythritol kinase [candidate division WOR-3 bacterium]|nr:4-(cytidine 5'-diphospho)-2-C-methyl-D-erythritol kinase [candidate division WOR-3 bacterium]